MTKAELVQAIADKTGQDKSEVSATVEAFFKEVKSTLKKGTPIFIRGFGTFYIKTRAAKYARNISQGTGILIPAHNIPTLKFSKEVMEEVKSSVPVKY